MRTVLLKLGLRLEGQIMANPISGIMERMDHAFSPLKTKAMNTMTQNQLVKQGQAWFEQLPPRDQSVVKLLGLLLAAALIFTMVWVPAKDRKLAAEAKLNSEISLYKWIQDNSSRVSKSATSSRGGSQNQSILAVVNNSSRAKNISLKRFEPDGPKGLRIWLENVVFDDLVSWLEDLQFGQGVTVTQINIEKEQSGRVNVRATLQK